MLSGSSKFNYLFPAAFMANTYAMTILLVVLGLAGKVDMAAEIGIVQGATLALFYAFSANARSLILNPASRIDAQSIMAARLMLIVPLAGVAYLLSIVPAEVDHFVAIALILRRCVEWLGEVHLSEMEHLRNRRLTWNYLMLQGILLATVLVWILGDLPYPLLGLLIWALVPLVISAKYIWRSFNAILDKLISVSSRILPNLGSTVIIGITVYIFRLLILLIVGKAAAGDLFTAFAIGGLTGGVFANALGPSIVLHEQRSGKHKFPFLVRLALYLSFILGIVIFAIAVLELPVLDWTKKSFFFWMATGLSMIGGVIMVYAQRIRLRLLQHDEENDVFGPDVMMNTLLIAAVPFTFYLLGVKAMSGLYLLSSVLAYFIYLSAKRGTAHWRVHETDKPIRIILAVMLLFPLFFQVSSGLFRNPTINYNSGGVLADLPIPLSVLACYAGIMLLGGYRKAFISFIAIFFTCILMIMATIFSTQSDFVQQQGKIILLIQYILPMFALALGQIYSSSETSGGDSYYEKTFLLILAVIIPWHLVATFYQGFLYLVPSLGLFSIYQDLQYVHVIMTGAYLLALYALWKFPGQRILLLLLLPLMAVYVAASMSLTATGMLLAGLIIFAAWRWQAKKEKLPAIICLGALLISSVYILYLMNHSAAAEAKFGVLEASGKSVERTAGYFVKSESNTTGDGIVIPANVHDRLNHWRHYLEKIAAEPKTLIIGSKNVADRVKYPSAHNYYLDFAYNFGLVALIPILTVLIYTCSLIYRYRKRIYVSPAMVGLCLVTLFLLLIDNSLKVGLRQPYPGIFTFFLWGLLLSRLLDWNNEGRPLKC